MLTRNIKAKRGRREYGWGDEEGGETEIRLMEERKFGSGAGLHGNHYKKTTGLS